MRRFLWILGLLWLGIPAHAEDLDAVVDRLRERYGVPGVAVVVVQDDRVVYAGGSGVRRVGTSDPMGPDTVMPVASVTKSFTAALAAIEVDEGKLGWDLPLANVLTDLRLNEDYPTLHVTLRDFLAHRSGLPAFTGDLFDNLGYSREEVIRRVRHLPLSAGFRQQGAYSNVGFFLAGMACARVEGDTWENLIQRKLLTPLKLTRSGFPQGPIPAGDYAYPHMPVAGSAPRALTIYDSQSVLAPAGMLSSSANDLARFARMLLNGGTLEGVRLLKPETVAEMFVPVTSIQPEFTDMAPIFADSGMAFAMGWGVYHYNGYQIVEKGGARAGVRSCVTLVPERKLAIVVLANLSVTALPEAVRAHVLETCLGPSRRDLQGAIWASQQQVNAMLGGVSLDPVPAPPVKAPSPVPLANYAGRYENDLYGDMTVRAEGQGLTWVMGPARFTGRLWPVAWTTFLMVNPPGQISLPGEVTFVLDEDGRARSLLSDELGEFRRKL
ncbi:MAG: serine hydrolase [Candidatus Eremiobacterota bacterium]